MNNFILEEGYLRYLNAKLQFYYCIFSIEDFNDTAFKKWSIHQPKSIRKATPKRRAEFLAGRYCAMKSLSNITDSFFINIGKNRSPIWPKGFIGSISHCNTYAISVTSKAINYKSLGIDTENIIDNKTRLSIQDQVLVNADKKTINESNICPELLFTIIFSLKESFFKAAYPLVKYYFDFNAISVIEIDFNKRRFLFKLNYTLNPCFISGQEFHGDFILITDNQVLTFITLQ